MPVRRIKRVRERVGARVEAAIQPKRQAVERVWSDVRILWPVRLVLVAWRRFKEDDSFALAGYLAYTGLLSFFPFLIFMVMSGSYIVGQERSLATVQYLFELSPPEVSGALRPVFEGIIESKTGFAAAISAMVGLWAGSNAFEAARIGFNKAYDVKEDRPFMKRRLQSLTLAAAAASVFVLQAFLIVLWPLISNLLEGDPLRNMDFESFDLLRYVVGMPLFMVLLSILHSRLPRGRRRGFMLHVRTEHGEDWAISIVPGVIASTLLWFLGATAFSLYLRFAPSFAGNYGAMAGVVITLLFFYMSSIVIFFGAQINIAREELRRKRSIHGGALSPETERFAAQTRMAPDTSPDTNPSASRSEASPPISGDPPPVRDADRGASTPRRDAS